MDETQQQAPPYPYNEEIDLRHIFRVLWKGKWIIGAITFSVTALALVVTLLLPNVYRAEALLAPHDGDGAGGLSALAAQYGGLASLAGISLNSGGADKTALGIEILRSRRFLSEFVERHEILVPLIAAKDWDPSDGQLRIDSDQFDETSNTWIRDVRPPKKKVPSLQEAHERFMEILSVQQDKKTGFVTVSVEHYSPKIAKQWVDWLVDDLNSSVMRQDVADAEQAIDYLNAQIETTSLADLRSVFFNLIEEQTKTVMLAKVSDEYLFKTVDPAVVPEKKAKPKRLIILILCMLFGGVIGILTVGILNTVKRPS